MKGSRRSRVPRERLCKPLGGGRGSANLFRISNTGHEDSITFLDDIYVVLVVIIVFSHEFWDLVGVVDFWHGTCSAFTYVFFLCDTSFALAFDLHLAGSASGGTTTHLYLFRCPIDFRVVFAQPSVPQDHALRTEASHCALGPLSVVVVAKDNVDDLGDRPVLVRRTVDVVDRDGLEQGTRGEVILTDKGSVEEENGGATVHQSRQPFDFVRICGLNFDLEL